MQCRDCWHRRDTQIYLPVPDATNLPTDFSILRTSPFCDIHSRHNFDTRSDCGLEIGRGLWLILQHTIDTEADFQLRGVGLNMNIACCHPDSIDNHLVNSMYDCWILAEVFLIYSKVVNSLTFKSGSCTNGSLNTSTEQALSSASIETDDCLVNVWFIRKNRRNLTARDEFNLVNENDIQDIHHRDPELITH